MKREQSAVRLAAFCVDERKRKRRLLLKILSRKECGAVRPCLTELEVFCM